MFEPKLLDCPKEPIINEEKLFSDMFLEYKNSLKNRFDADKEERIEFVGALEALLDVDDIVDILLKNGEDAAVDMFKRSLRLATNARAAFYAECEINSAYKAFPFIDEKYRQK